MTVVPNVAYCSNFPVCFHHVVMSMWQMPSDDICESDWLVGGGLFPLRALICFRAHQSFGDFFSYASPFSKFSDFNSATVTRCISYFIYAVLQSDIATVCG